MLKEFPQENLRALLKSFYEGKNEDDRVVVRSDKMVIINSCNKMAKAIRIAMNINNEEYIDSVCNREWISMTNQGRSGSLFYRTADNSFLIKTMFSHESKMLKKFFVKYTKVILSKKCICIAADPTFFKP